MVKRPGVHLETCGEALWTAWFRLSGVSGPSRCSPEDSVSEMGLPARRPSFAAE